MSTDTSPAFREWLAKRILDATKPPLRVVLNLGEVDVPVPPLLATTVEGMKAIQAHNARVGVFT